MSVSLRLALAAALMFAVTAAEASDRIRVAAQRYNRVADYERLAKALKQLVG